MDLHPNWVVLHVLNGVEKVFMNGNIMFLSSFKLLRCKQVGLTPSGGLVTDNDLAFSSVCTLTWFVPYNSYIECCFVFTSTDFWANLQASHESKEEGRQEEEVECTNAIRFCIVILPCRNV